MVKIPMLSDAISPVDIINPGGFSKYVNLPVRGINIAFFQHDLEAAKFAILLIRLRQLQGH
jgi:hypothetical protein